MSDLTVDVGVLMSGAGVGNRKYRFPSRALMDTMKESSVARLVMDTEGFIEHSYGKLKNNYGEWWFRRMSDLDKVHYVPRKYLDRGTQTQLQEAHFDREDCKYYVRTAASSRSKRLVSHDPDYSPSVCRILRRRLRVSLLDANQAGALFTTEP